MSDQEKDAREDEEPTLPSGRFKTPFPRREPRKLSGTMIIRFNEALKNLAEPAKALDAVRAKARDLCTVEEKREAFNSDISGEFPVPKSGEEKKDK